MKKIIGIVLALCMLFTMASAATITNPVAPSEVNPTDGVNTMSVSITYAGLDSTAQATMLAYVVDDEATADAIPAFVDTETTPIVGIDQELADCTFDFTVPSTFRGKVAVMIGGDDVTTPVSMLVEFKDATVTPDPEEPGTGGEGGEGGDEPEYVEVTVICGDVNGDGAADGTDAGYILGSAGRNDKYGDYAIGTVITTIGEVDIVCGDVNGDGVADGTDAGYILGSAGRNDKYGDYAIGTEITFNVPKSE